MPRRKRLPVAAPSLPLQGALRPTTPRSPQLIPFDLPDLDEALGGGLPLGRLTEIIGANEPAQHLLAARFIAARQRRAPAVRAVWLDLGGRLDPALLATAGLDLDQVVILAPRDGAETLSRAYGYLVSHPAHVLVISGLPRLGRRDALFVGLLERLAFLLPGARTILLCLSNPERTGAALARLAAVRLLLENEQVTGDRRRTILEASITVLKHRFARAGAQVALRIAMTPLRKRAN